MPHAAIKLHISPAQLAKVNAGKPIQLKHEHINHAHGHSFTHLHPTNLAKIKSAHRSKKGVRVHLTYPELEGTGLWDVLKKGWNWVKKNKDILKPIASAALDAGAAFVPEAAPLRGIVKTMTGVGIEQAHPSKSVKGPQFFPGQHVEASPSFIMKKPAKRSRKKLGKGIVPAGY